METLSLAWADVEVEIGVIHLRSTKSGRPRAIPYRGYPELAAVIERRLAVAEQLKRAGIITPWVFCFNAPIAVLGRLYRAAGAPLFKAGASGGLLTSLRCEWKAACAGAGLPGRMFHDLRRSAARNLERAGVPRGVAMKLCGWTERMYSRYAIGAESEIEAALPRLSDYLRSCGLHSGDTHEKSSTKSRKIRTVAGRVRT